MVGGRGGASGPGWGAVQDSQRSRVLSVEADPNAASGQEPQIGVVRVPFSDSSPTERERVRGWAGSGQHSPTPGPVTEVAGLFCAEAAAAATVPYPPLQKSPLPDAWPTSS